MRRAVALVFALTFALGLANETQRSWGPPQKLCSLSDNRIDESSGVAASLRESGVFYTHNDSGDKPRFFRFRRDGTVDGVYELKGVKAFDWEDICSARVDGTPYLYLADIGDNRQIRKEIVVYRVKEPTKTGDQTITEFDTYTFRYPDKPHDCEAIFVTKSGDIYLVTKARDGMTGVFVMNPPKSGETYTLRHIRNLDVKSPGPWGNQVTAADLSPDQKHVVIRTYSTGFEYAVPKNFNDWTKAAPKSVKIAKEAQGEAICYSRDGSYILTTSERAPCPVSILALNAR